MSPTHLPDVRAGTARSSPTLSTPFLPPLGASAHFARAPCPLTRRSAHGTLPRAHRPPAARPQVDSWARAHARQIPRGRNRKAPSGVCTSTAQGQRVGRCGRWWRRPRCPRHPLATPLWKTLTRTWTRLNPARFARRVSMVAVTSGSCLWAAHVVILTRPDWCTPSGCFTDRWRYHYALPPCRTLCLAENLKSRYRRWHRVPPMIPAGTTPQRAHLRTEVGARSVSSSTRRTQHIFRREECPAAAA